MQKNITLISLIASLSILTSCTLGMNTDAPTTHVTPTPTVTNTGNMTGDAPPAPTPTASLSGVLEFSQTGNILLAPVMTHEYRYLDSEKKVFATGTLASLLASPRGTIVYFYPKDGTPNCTIQALDFSMMLADFRSQGYEVIGVSKDSIDSHKHFADVNELKIKLVEDGSGELLKAFGAEGPLQEYGNGTELSDIIRSTYVVTPDGQAVYAFRDVTAKGHARRIYQLVTGQEYMK